MALSPFKSITTRGTTGAGAALSNQGIPVANHTMVVTTGIGVSAGSVQFEGSLDGTNWFNLGTAISTVAASTTYSVSVANTPACAVRANIKTAITGGTISAVVASC